MWAALCPIKLSIASFQDVDPSTALKMDDPALKRRNARKLLECVNKLEVNIMNPPRKGKKLLVLDLDYTILVRNSPPLYANKD